MPNNFAIFKDLYTELFTVEIISQSDQFDLFKVTNELSKLTFEIAYAFVDDEPLDYLRSFYVEYADTVIWTNADISNIESLLLADAMYFLRCSHNPDLDEESTEYAGKRFVGAKLVSSTNDIGSTKLIGY